MKTLNVTKELSSEDVVREAQNSEVVLMSNGHPVALVSALDDDASDEELVADGFTGSSASLGSIHEARSASFTIV